MQKLRFGDSIKSPAASKSSSRRAAVTPRYDVADRTLWVGQTIIKRFRVPAGNQDLILSSLEEQDWKRRIDDPLPPKNGLKAKTRLKRAVRDLNRNQRVQMLRFHADGTGRGIIWELTGP